MGNLSFGQGKSLAMTGLVLLVGIVLLLGAAAPATVVAQEKKKDNTGTNPVNFPGTRPVRAAEVNGW